MTIILSRSQACRAPHKNKLKVLMLQQPPMFRGLIMWQLRSFDMQKIRSCNNYCRQIRTQCNLRFTCQDVCATFWAQYRNTEADYINCMLHVQYCTYTYNNYVHNIRANIQQLRNTDLGEVGKFCHLCSCVHLICRLVWLLSSLVFGGL